MIRRLVEEFILEQNDATHFKLTWFALSSSFYRSCIGMYYVLVQHQRVRIQGKLMGRFIHTYSTSVPSRKPQKCVIDLECVQNEKYPK